MSRRLRQRIVALQRRHRAAAATPLRLAVAEETVLDRWAQRLLPRRQDLELRLERAGLAIGPGRYLLINAAVMACLAAAALLGGLTPLTALGLGVAGGMVVTHMAVGMLGSRRNARFLGLFAETIDLLVRGLRSGLPISESMEMVGREIADPVGAEFRAVINLMRLGKMQEEALSETARRLDLPEFNFFIVALSVQRETGGNLAETLSNLSDILRRRHQMKSKIRALSSEARASAAILGGLPVVVFGALLLVSPDYITVLLTDVRGHIILAAGAASEVIGLTVMTRMARFPL